MEIRIWVKQNDYYWYFIPRRFQQCPLGEFTYNGEADLDKIRKSDWNKIGRCPDRVKIRNIATGYKRETWPIKISPNN